MAKYEYRGQNTQTFGRLPGYKKIVAWQAASDLSYLVSAGVAGFGPVYYGLANQMRGAAHSVHGNLAEGYCSGTLPNYMRCCHHARGSLGELGSYLQSCEREGLLTAAGLAELLQQYGTVVFLLDRLLRALIEKEQSGTWDTQFGVKAAPAAYHTAGAEPDDLSLGTDPDLPDPPLPANHFP